MNWWPRARSIPIFVILWLSSNEVTHFIKESIFIPSLQDCCCCCGYLHRSCINMIAAQLSQAQTLRRLCLLTKHLHCHVLGGGVTISASKRFIRRFVITEKAPTGAFSWLKAATTAFTFKTLLRHYAKRALTPRSLNVKLGLWRNYHKGRAGS